MDERSVQRALDLLGEAGYLEKLNPGSKPLRWRWPKSRKYLTLPRLADQEILAFRLLELFLRPLLPPEAYQALRPYFEAAQNELNKLLSWAPVKAWESKVRVIPPAQPLLPPELPLPLAAAADPQQWRTHQAAVRDAVLKALFENQQCLIEYQQPWRDEPVRWTIHPLVYVQRGPAFYLLCTIDDYRDVLQLALHRILSVKVLEQKASQPARFDVDREVERCQGMGGSGEPIRLVARFWRPAGLHVLETPLSSDQMVGEEDDDHFRLIATVNDTAQLRWWLLSFGSKVEVLEPMGLRAEMANQAYWMNRMYTRPAPGGASGPDG